MNSGAGMSNAPWQDPSLHGPRVLSLGRDGWVTLTHGPKGDPRGAYVTYDLESDQIAPTVDRPGEGSWLRPGPGLEIHSRLGIWNTAAAPRNGNAAD